MPSHRVVLIAVEIEKDSIHADSTDLLDSVSDVEQVGSPSAADVLDARVAVDDTSVGDKSGQSRERPQVVAELRPRHFPPQSCEEAISLRWRKEIFPVSDPPAVAQRNGLSGRV